jgi:hypothetical protein
MTAALLTGIALTGPATARDRTDRVELSANQMVDRSDARIAKMKVDLNSPRTKTRTGPDLPVRCRT